MLTKFETKSNRVKGLAFHPKRPWILASLHSGAIQLWDYRIGTLIDRFVDHDGPVRGVEFHPSQPIFVSGGDDYKVKIWSYKTRRCQFTLTGHLDYVRTVRFHPEKPWLVSASDDQTVRIWNWQSRTCLSVLTGHNHYVMCAAFHPKEDLVVSASLDQTIRVWDISSLCKRSVAPGGQDESSMNADLFGGGDAAVKYVLEGHERGVNWASFHPTLPLIVSGADDRLIKLWRMNDSKAWEVDSLRGHMNNVSCVIFSGRQDVIVSNSEDRTIRIWDMSRRTALQTFRREHERFWILAAHPEINLLAAGHDSGMLVFKLERERPPHALHQNSLFYVATRSGTTSLRFHDVATGQSNLLQVIPKLPNATRPPVMRSMSYNPAENALLINSDEEGGTYRFFKLAGGAPASLVSRGEVPETFSGQGGTAVFIARNRFAVWNRFSSTIQIHNLDNEITKRCPAPDPSMSALFYAGTGLLLCRCDDKVILLDVQQRSSVAELQAPLVKYVVWNSSMTMVALLSKHNVVIADSKLQNSATVHETIRVKSASWNESGVLLYTTLNHIKYCLPGGDSGIVKTLDQPVYIVTVVGDTVHALDRDGKTLTMQIDSSEFAFKRALALRNHDVMRSLIRSKKLCGQAIISFLRAKKHPEVALLFVADDRERFEVALECGNIEVALAAAQRLGDSDILGRLGSEAFRQGNLEIAEKCCQQTKAFERLSFLYAISGNTDKLWKMLKLSELRGDIMSRYSNTLYLGSATARTKVLEDAGHMSLAHVSAAAHGLVEEAARLREKIGEKADASASVVERAELMMPLTPILRLGNWPLLEVSAASFNTGAIDVGGLAAGSVNGAAPAVGGTVGGVEVEDDGDADAWGGEELDIGLDGDERGKPLPGGEEGDEEEEDGGWEMEDMELPAELAKEAATTGGPYTPPPPGAPASQRWAAKSKLAVELCAAGSFPAAARMLELQIGVVNLDPLKDNMLAASCSAFTFVSGMAGLPPMCVGLDSTWTKSTPTPDAPTTPVTPFKMPAMETTLRAAYKSVTDGKFQEAKDGFQNILVTLPLVTVETRRQVDDVKELVSIAREYHTFARCELTRKSLPTTDIRSAELAAYFTHCKLQNAHMKLALQVAMRQFYNRKLFASCASFAHRLLELDPPSKTAASAQQVLAACEQNPSDAQPITYDPRNPFDLCPATFTPIYRGTHSVVCPYTDAKFTAECEGQLSPVGDLALIGKTGSGLMCSHTQRS